jgi:hypothetical protein
MKNFAGSGISEPKRSNIDALREPVEPNATESDE